MRTACVGVPPLIRLAEIDDDLRRLISVPGAHAHHVALHRCRVRTRRPGQIRGRRLVSFSGARESGGRCCGAVRVSCCAKLTTIAAVMGSRAPSFR